MVKPPKGALQPGLLSPYAVPFPRHLMILKDGFCTVSPSSPGPHHFTVRFPLLNFHYKDISIEGVTTGFGQ